MDPVKIKQHTDSYNAAGFVGVGVGVVNTTVNIQQIETVYFMNQEGKIEPYIKIIRRVTDRSLFWDSEKKKGKWIDRDLPEKYFSPDQLGKMETYAETNKLSFKLKDDLQKILDSVQ